MQAKSLTSAVDQGFTFDPTNGDSLEDIKGRIENQLMLEVAETKQKKKMFQKKGNVITRYGKTLKNHFQVNKHFIIR